MVVVVPALAVGPQAHQPVVAAVVIGFVVTIAPDVGKAVHAPGDVPGEYRADKHAPHQPACAKLNATGQTPHWPTNEEACEEEHDHRHEIDLEPVLVLFELHVERVA